MHEDECAKQIPRPGPGGDNVCDLSVDPGAV